MLSLFPLPFLSFTISFNFFTMHFFLQVLGCLVEALTPSILGINTQSTNIYYWYLPSSTSIDIDESCCSHYHALSAPFKVFEINLNEDDLSPLNSSPVPVPIKLVNFLLFFWFIPPVHVLLVSLLVLPKMELFVVLSFGLKWKWLMVLILFFLSFLLKIILTLFLFPSDIWVSSCPQRWKCHSTM